MRILVVEDNLELGQNLRKGLREHGLLSIWLTVATLAWIMPGPGPTIC